MRQLADFYSEQGKYIQAELFFQRTLAVHEQTLEARPPETASVLHAFAKLREAQGNIQDAADLYRRALVIREQAYGSQHPLTIETSECLHAILISQEDISKEKKD